MAGEPYPRNNDVGLGYGVVGVPQFTIHQRLPPEGNLGVTMYEAHSLVEAEKVDEAEIYQLAMADAVKIAYSHRFGLVLKFKGVLTVRQADALLGIICGVGSFEAVQHALQAIGAI